MMCCVKLWIAYSHTCTHNNGKIDLENNELMLGRIKKNMINWYDALFHVMLSRFPTARNRWIWFFSILWPYVCMYIYIKGKSKVLHMHRTLPKENFPFGFKTISTYVRIQNKWMKPLMQSAKRESTERWTSTDSIKQCIVRNTVSIAKGGIKSKTQIFIDQSMFLCVLFVICC